MWSRLKNWPLLERGLSAVMTAAPHQPSIEERAVAQCCDEGP